MDNPLGKTLAFPQRYCPEILYRVERNRADMPGHSFHGFDRWVCYELTWLDSTGSPRVGTGALIVPANSPCIVESKSLKLYLGSFAFEPFADAAALSQQVQRDLATLLESPALCFEIAPLTISSMFSIADPPGRCIDDLTAPTDAAQVPTPGLLHSGSETVSETVHSNLFRSLCPVTAQPDFATVVVSYRGPKILDQSLLQYLCSFRSAAGFHEHCCERITYDLTRLCNPEELSVTCYFTRRGGIEINPSRFSCPDAASEALVAARHSPLRMVRQ